MSSRPVGTHQRTTLSFLLATVAVASSAFLGLDRAAASATAIDEIRIESSALPIDRGRADSPNPSDETTPVAEPSTATTPVEATQGTTATTSTTTTTTTTMQTAKPTTAPATATVVTPHTMAIREWRAVSQASFQGFVEARGFTTVEYITPALVHGTIVGNDQRVNVVLVHRSATTPMRVSPAHRGREPVGEWARAVGATAGINANWYNPFDGPAVSDGRVYGGSDHGYTALFGFTAAGDLVADHHHKIHDRVDPRVVEAVSGHPTLVHRGTPTTDFGTDPTFTERQPRTVIGVSRSVDVLILVAVDGRRADARGMTGAETTSLMQRLGAHDAVMLDGGGSTAMWISGKGIVNRQSDPGRAVGNQLAVFGR